MKGTVWIAAAVMVAGGVACADTPPTNINLPTSYASGSGGGGGGSSSGGAAPEATAQQLYDDGVHDDLLLACGACHAQGAVGAPVFLNSDKATSYALLEAHGSPLIHIPDNSLLLQKGEHSGPALDGPGVASELQANVVDWLLEEAKERDLEPDPEEPPGLTFDDAMEAFADCMRQDAWDGSGMDIVPLNQTQGMGPCLGCHNTGVGGLFLDDNSQLSFAETQKNKYRLQKYVAPGYDADGNFEKLIVSTRLLEKGSETCPFEDPDDCHPKYSLEPQNWEAIQEFVAFTLEAVEGESCDAPYDDGVGGAGGGVQ